MTKFIKLQARVRSLAFIEEEEAAWLAVRTLLIAKTSGADFPNLYLGMLELQARKAYLQKGIKDHLWPAPGSDPLALEMHCRHAQHHSEKVATILIADIVRLGRVIDKMNEGSSKASAFKDTQEWMQRMYFEARRTRVGESRFRLPASETTLKALWKKYSDVLPYVYAEHLQSLSRAKGLRGIRYNQLAVFPYAFNTILAPSKRTKSNVLPRLQALEFV